VVPPGSDNRDHWGPDGRYRLRAIADPADHVQEHDETNNDTWTVVDLSTIDAVRRVEVVEQGPAG
jgi:subtilase family serine protease